MDFPNDVATNVYKIDGVEEIYWAFHTIKRNEDGIHKTLPETGEEDLKHVVYAIERNLRERDIHVLLDDERDKLGVWTFCLSGTEQQEAFEILDLSELERDESGSIKSSALASSSGHAGIVPRSSNVASVSQRSAVPLSDLNQQCLNTSASYTTRSPTGGSDVLGKAGYSTIDIYPKILLAFSRSVIHSLCKHERYLQIGHATCVDVQTLGDSMFDRLESFHPDENTTTFTCTVRWLSAGVLLFLLSSESMPKMCTLSRTLSSTESLATTSLGEPLLLSPSGVVGHCHGVERTPRIHPLYKVRLEARTSISTMLQRYGISLPQESQWIRVRLGFDGDHDRRMEIDKGRIDDEQTGQLVLWPAHLCLCRNAQLPTEIGTHHRLTESLAFENDPLERAQSWFLGKHARAETLVNRQRKLAEEAEETERAKESENAEDEDAFSDYQIHINQVITPRDVSGIYPTPPDGVPSVVHDVSLDSDQHYISNDDDDDVTGPTANDGMHKSYEHKRQDDLFGEMDIELFATNGLTEDDFSFFDEPDIQRTTLQDNIKLRYGEEDIATAAPVSAAAGLMPFDGWVDSKPHASHNLLAGAGVSSSRDEQRLASGDVSTDDRTLAGQTMGKMNPDNTPAHTKRSSSIKKAEESEASQLYEPRLGSILTDSKLPQETSFTPIPFYANNFDFDDKYALQGRYGFDLEDLPNAFELQKLSLRPDRTLPHVGQTQGSSLENDTDLDTSDEEISIKSPDLSQYHDEKKVIDETHQQTHRKRKRGSSEEDCRPTTPMSSVSLGENPEMQGEVDLIPGSQSFSPGACRKADLLYDRKPEKERPEATVMVGNDKSFVQIAQLVADQGISCSTTLPQTGHLHHAITKATEIQSCFHQILTGWSSKCGKGSKRCTLRDFREADDQESFNVVREPNGQRQKLQKIPHPVRASVQSVGKVPGPYVRVQRIGTLIDIAVPALRFWEELSLEPCHGSKNVTAYCIYPMQLNIQHQVITFLTMIKGAYQSCKLGSHNLGSDHAHVANGLLPVPMATGEISTPYSEMNRAYENLGTWLGKLKLEGGNTVIYVMKPSGNEGSLPRLCAAFLRLCGNYTAAVKGHDVDKPNDLVLQIIPSDLVYSQTFLPMPSPAEYRKLAFEVYDRCAPDENRKDVKRSQYNCAPSVRLAKTLPKTIDFRLTSENSALSLQSDNYLHVGYAWTLGEEWLTASWTDNLGLLSWTACYSFGEGMDPPWQSLSEIAKEIWETTLEMLQPRKGPWRLFLSKEGAVCKEEMNAWQSLLSTSGQMPIKSPVSFTFLTIDSNPLLHFPEEHPVARGPELATGYLETPDTTPQVHAFSPDSSGLNMTPGGPVQVSTPPPNMAAGDHDPEARLIDPTDETWGILLNHTMDDASIPSNCCPALASGLLVKRAGVRDEDGLVRMGVNVIHGPKPHRPLLNIVLTLYKNLGLLARIRGVVDPGKSLIPYHIAVAGKAHATVCSTMRYGEE